MCSLPLTLGVINNDDGTGHPRFYGDGTPGPGALPKFGGWAVDGTAVLIAYTWYGDANLDGVVDDKDVALLNAGLADPTLKGWMNGDFNYDGVVNATDVWLCDAGKNQQHVPEPASLVLLGLGGAVLLGRRKK